MSDTSAPSLVNSGPWLFSARLDVAVFGGSALLAVILLLVGAATGLLDGATPPWLWIATVVFVDVAHVWSTSWRTYLDPVELRRRPALYWCTPLFAWIGGVLLYSASSALFWRVLAYVAVFHFVRQQSGWMSLYRRRLGESTRLDRRLDHLAIHAATLYPLLWWHAHLPLEFAWLIQGDFLPGLPKSAASLLLPVHLAIMAVHAGRQIQLLVQGRPVSAGKNLVLWTTWAAWFGGIVLLGSDYAFTVTNVLIHGIPYLALTWVHGRGRWGGGRVWQARAFQGPRGVLLIFLLPLFAVAWAEEWVWDLIAWQESAQFFPGPHWDVPPDLLAFLVPLLAVPQATHYILDAFIWRVRDDPALPRRLGWVA